MRASEKDKDYFRRLGEYKKAAHEEQLREHLALPLIERIERSIAFAEEMRGSVNLSRRVDDPTAFHRLARARGLYQP